MKRLAIACLFTVACATHNPVPPASPVTVSPVVAASAAPDEVQQAPSQLPTPPDVAAPPADAERSASGLASKVLQPGDGAVHPSIGDIVEVHYSGWTTDGNLFDSSVVRGEPATFPLAGVIPGWSEGVQLMVVGEKRRLWIPEALAYQGNPNAPAGMLVFDVELIAIHPATAP